MIAVLCGLLAVVIVAIVFLAALMGWGDRVTRCQRYGLCVMASGLILASVDRFMQGVGLADLMFLLGLATYLLNRHLKFILHRADALDGAPDGRYNLLHFWRRRANQHDRLKQHSGKR